MSQDSNVVIARQRRFYSKLIYRAICDIVNYRNSKSDEHTEIYESAVDWMYNGPDPVEEYETMCDFDDVMAFTTACSMLKWDPDWIRKKVKKLTRRDLEHIGRNGLI